MDPITAFIINLIINLVVAAASTLIASIFAQDKKNVQGVRGSIQTGGDHPLSFIMGFYGTAGHLKYAGTWGDVGGTPNAYYSKVISVSDLPVRGLAGFFVNGERVTLLTGEAHADRGFPVLEYRSGGTDHLWVKFYDGKPNDGLGGYVDDPLMVANFGADPDRPYVDMIGRGVAYFIATALVNRDLFSGLPEYLAEIDGIPLDDPRGDDAHENPLVGIYTIMKGIRYDGEWVYGPQNITDNSFIAANLEAQMDKCDVAIPLEGGGTQKRFRFGLEVSVDSEPQAVIGELLKACEGRIAEIGGIYKFLVGEPDAPVVSYTDEDVVITEQQNYDPFPGLESLFNGITATYPEPAEAWESKEAPPRYRSDLEALDDGRRLPFSTSYKAVPYAVQVQALMRAAIEETRRFRALTETMPPEWWEYEPLDAVVRSSLRNGFEDKVMLITAMDDLPNGNQFVGTQEVDPDDYDWTSSYQLPFSFSPLVIGRPAPQEIIGWNVAPYIFPDSTAEGRRIGIEVFYDEGQLDVRAVRVQVREDFGDNNLVFDGEFPYDPAEIDPSRALTWAGIIPAEDYEVRGIYVPFSGRAVEWSGWLGVTTPPPQLSERDFYPDLGNTLEVLNVGLEWLAASNKAVRDDLQSVVVRLQDQGNTSDDNFQQVRTALSVTQGLIKSDYELLITTAVGVIDGRLVGISSRVESLEVAYADPVSGNSALASGLNAIVLQVTDGTTGLVALANSINSIETSVGDISADAKIRMVSQASSGSSYATVGIQARATTGDVWTTAAILLDSKSDGSSRVLLVGQRIGLMDSGGTVYAMFDASGAYFANARIANLTAANVQAGSITADRLNVTDLSAISANLGSIVVTNANIANLTVGRLQIADGAATDFSYTNVTTPQNYPSGGTFTKSGSSFTCGQGPFITAIRTRYTLTGSAPSWTARHVIELINVSAGGTVVSSRTIDISNSTDYTLNETFIDIGPAGATCFYRVTWQFTPSSGSVNVTLQNYLIAATVNIK